MIHFTTDGSDPTPDSLSTRPGEVVVWDMIGVTTFKAIATKEGLRDSDMVEKTYVIMVSDIIDFRPLQMNVSLSVERGLEMIISSSGNSLSAIDPTNLMCVMLCREERHVPCFPVPSMEAPTSVR